MTNTIVEKEHVNANSLQLQPVKDPVPQKTKATAAEWLIPIGLIMLSAVPVIAGAIRMNELAGNATVTPDNARFFASPLPVVLHIISVSLYSVLGAFQFAPGFRHRRRGWHRMAGRVLVPAGLITALSGLWMSHFYPWPSGDGVLLYGLRLIFGSAMLISILLGVAALRRRDFARHGAWMMRGYAIALGAGTQVFTHVAWILIIGTGKPGEIPRALLMGAGWIINLALAEWLLRRQSAGSVRLVSTEHPYRKAM